MPHDFVRTLKRPFPWMTLARDATVALVLVAVATVGLVPPARAANTLENPSVTPRSGTTSTVFVFSVEYRSSPPGLPAREVWAEVGGVRIELAAAPLDGTYTGRSTLPAGEWDVTFRATEIRGSQPSPISGGRIRVVSATPRPTVPPTAAPTPVPTPIPATPAPTPTLAATPAVVVTPLPSESATVGTPGGELFTPSPTADPTATATATAGIAATASPEGGDGVNVAQVMGLFIGGLLAGSGAAFAGVQVVQRRPWRRLRRLTPFTR